MTPKPGQKIFILLLPLLLVAGAYPLMPYTQALPQFLLEQVAVLPYLALLSTVIVGSIFKKYRLIILSIALLASYIIVQAASHTLVDKQQMAAIGLLGIGLPITLVYLNLLEERHLFSLQSLLAICVIMAEVFSGWWVLNNFSEILVGIFSYELDLLLGFVNRTNIPTIAILANVLGGLFLLYRFWRSKSVFESAFLGVLLAMLYMMHSFQDPVISSLFMTIAGLIMVGALVQNSYFIAYIDELTELPGRRALNEELRRLRGQYAIAMLDVDHFKSFNDTYGHDIGDQVLRMVASKLARVGGGGKPFRYGGEEFCVVFSGKDMKATFPHLSTVRQSIDDTRMVLRSKDRPKQKPEKVTQKRRRMPWREVHVTISIGVAEKGGKLETPEDVIKAADTALYKAKEKGRNRISQYGNSLTEQTA